MEYNWDNELPLISLLLQMYVIHFINTKKTSNLIKTSSMIRYFLTYKNSLIHQTKNLKSNLKQEYNTNTKTR